MITTIAAIIIIGPTRIMLRTVCTLGSVLLRCEVPARPSLQLQRFPGVSGDAMTACSQIPQDAEQVEQNADMAASALYFLLQHDFYHTYTSRSEASYVTILYIHSHLLCVCGRLSTRQNTFLSCRFTESRNGLRHGDRHNRAGEQGFGKHSHDRPFLC